MPGIARQPVLEPEHRVEVEMVGRLVEQQQVRAAHQRLREIKPHAPAAGEARHRLALARVGEAEPGEQRRRARPRAVAADRLEAMMQLGQPLAAGMRIDFRVASAPQRALDRAQLGVAVVHVVDRRRRDCAVFPARRARSPTPAAARPRPRRHRARRAAARTATTCRCRWRRSARPCARRARSAIAPSSRRLLPRESVRLLRRSIVRYAAARSRSR